MFGSLADAEEYASRRCHTSETLQGCAYLVTGDCLEEEPFVTAWTGEDEPSFFVSDVNACYLVRALGLRGLEGSLPPSELLGRVLAAQALYVAAVPSAPFMDERMAYLADICQWAIDHGREVQWG